LASILLLLVKQDTMEKVSSAEMKQYNAQSVISVVVKVCLVLVSSAAVVLAVLGLLIFVARAI